MPREDIEFKTLDGVILRGWLFPAASRGSAVILTPGFNCVKEMFTAEPAEAFQSAGITALVYDPRSTGTSEGEPRNEIDPVKQVSDYSDALTYLTTLPIVDPNSIGYWGMSFSATVALCAAALDKRAKFVISVCPLMTFANPNEKFANLLAKTMKDREFQLKGNKPFYIPLLTETGENPAGVGIWSDKETLEYITTAKERLAPSFESRITIQTYYKMMMWQPTGLIKYVSPTPVLVLIPELDKVSPPEDQVALFDSLSQPKKMHMAQGKGHLNVLSGDDFPILMKLQVDCIEAALAGSLGME
ncbi:Alpha/Beta hydrolase protein [Tricladium varicosporioides]|nr:Alpha/Beta hydrolase protein [Hymenoscyphus varicosporioides]